MNKNIFLKFKEQVQKKARPSHVLGEIQHQQLIDALMSDSSCVPEQSVLGQVHLDLAKYHELNRFVEENESYDHDAALYHLGRAAQCGSLAAIISMANIHLGIPHDILPDIEVSITLLCYFEFSYQTIFQSLMKMLEILHWDSVFSCKVLKEETEHL